jgi:hypothetical protein
MSGAPTTPATIQQDLFCSCGYNLLSQRVEVDERLGLPVCRCPECGRYHALGTTLASQTPTARLWGVIVIIFVWLVTLYVVGCATVGLLALQFGQAAVWQETNRTSYYNYDQWPWLDQFLYAFATPLLWLANVLGALVYGSLLAALCWHWPRGRHRWLMGVPALVYILGLVFGASVDRLFARYESQFFMFTAAMFQIVGMWLGLRTGRGLVRGLLRMFLSPRALQPLACLWLVDAKPLPGPVAEVARGASGGRGDGERAEE